MYIDLILFCEWWALVFGSSRQDGPCCYSSGEGSSFDELFPFVSLSQSEVQNLAQMTNIERMFRQTGSYFLFLLSVSQRWGSMLCFVVFNTVDQGWLFTVVFWHPLLQELGFHSNSLLSKFHGWVYFTFIFWSSCLYMFYSTPPCFSVFSQWDLQRFPPHVLHPWQIVWGVLLYLHSAFEQDMEGNEGNFRGL